MKIKVVTLAGPLDRETEVAADIARQRRLELAFRCLDRSELLAALRAGGIDAVVSVGPVPWADFQCMEEARTRGVAMYGLAADPIEAEMLEVAGFKIISGLEQVAAHTETPPAIQETLEPQQPPAAGKLIAVWGPKGSPGRTTVAIELAAILAQSDPSTLLVDADLYGGDVSQLLGVAEELSGIVPLCRKGASGELRDEGWTAELRRVGGGPVVVPGLLRAELWGEVSPFGFRQLLEAARGSFTTTVLDVGFCLEAPWSIHEGPGRNDVALAAVEAADQVVVVARADAVGIRSFLWSFTDAREALDPDTCVVVLNRVRPGEETEVSNFVRRYLGRPPLALIPDRPDHVVRAVWEGLPVCSSAPSSPISLAVRELAARLGAEVPPRGFLTRLAGRRAHV